MHRILADDLLAFCRRLRRVVTHRFELAERFRRQQPDGTVFLRAERRPDGSRNYKLAAKDPLPTSFGEDLYYRLGGWLDEDEAFTPATPEAACRHRPERGG